MGIIISRIKTIPINQPGFHGSCQGFEFMLLQKFQDVSEEMAVLQGEVRRKTAQLPVCSVGGT